MGALLRFTLIVLAIAGLAFTVTILLRDPMTSLILGAACTWTLVANVQGLLAAPEGQRLIASSAFQKFFDPYIVRPVIRPVVGGAVWLFDRANDILEWIADNPLNVVKWFFLSILWVVGFAIISVVVYMIFKSISAIPVSLAIIIGAVIIASVLQRR